jgi:CPA1 family monovalent cation:H+ antiporter
MTGFQVLAIVVALVAAFGYLNHRFVRLPDAIGITAIGIVVSLVAVVAASFNPRLAAAVETAAHFDFAGVLLHGVLGLLLFAGSAHIQIADLAREKWLIATLATLGVVVSTAIVGVAFWAATHALGLGIPLLACLLFGALISPTDPVAVLAVLKRLGVPKSLEARIAGESLFNDGTGVVVFLTLLQIATAPGGVEPATTALLFVTEVVGGGVFGFAGGSLGVRMLRRVDSHPIEILITLALATGGYALAEALHVSAPIAVVVMGLIVGNRGRREAMSEATQRRLFDFWDVLDELLNLLLFGLIGLVMMSLTISAVQAAAALSAIVIVLGARLASVGVPIALVPRLRPRRKATITIMTWGGLRGGISIALALSLPAQVSGRATIVTTTYAVVIFSILVQALTLERVAKRALAEAERQTLLP